MKIIICVKKMMKNKNDGIIDYKNIINNFNKYNYYNIRYLI